MNGNSEEKYRQLVLTELAGMIADEDGIRVSFAPGTETHRQLTILANQREVKPRDIVISAVRVFFAAVVSTSNEKSVN